MMFKRKNEDYWHIATVYLENSLKKTNAGNRPPASTYSCRSVSSDSTAHRRSINKCKFPDAKAHFGGFHDCAI